MSRIYDPAKRRRQYLARKARNQEVLRAEGRRSGLVQMLKSAGIGRAEYEAALARQGGRCALCNEAPQYGRRLSVDHDHVVGGFRGLLCTHCNLALGHLFDSLPVLEKALEYVRCHRASKIS